MKERPNIIIFNPDQMRADAMRHMGNPAAYTLNLDAFAREDAVSFSNAYCQNPVCVPSRCSFMTGLYPHVHGHRTMNYLQQPGESNLLQELHKNGYYVWMNARNDLVTGNIPGLVESQADEVFYYDKGAPTRFIPASATAQMMKGKGKNPYPYSHYTGVSDMTANGDIRDVHAAIKRIETYREEKPLCMFIGLANPHPPYAVPQKYYDLIQDIEKWPRRHGDELTNPPEMIKGIQARSGLHDWKEEQWNDLRRTYLAQCALVDDLFGQLCEALKKTGMYDNSAIFFLSDHGDFTGDYDLPEKAQNVFADCLTRVPLLIKPPKGMPLDAGVSSSLVELVDFYATAMEYAGVKPDHDQFGRSLQSIIADRTQKIRDSVFCEGGRRADEIHCDEYHTNDGKTPEGSAYWARMKTQADPAAHEKGTMIFDGRYKFVERLSGKHEFYDLQTDPQELVNLYEEGKGNPEILRLRIELLHWYQETCDIVPYQQDRRFTEERVWASTRMFCPPGQEAQMRAYIHTGKDIPQTIAWAMRQQSEGNL